MKKTLLTFVITSSFFLSNAQNQPKKAEVPAATTEKVENFASNIKFNPDEKVIFFENVSEKYGKMSKKVKNDEKGSNMAEKGQN